MIPRVDSDRRSILKNFITQDESTVGHGGWTLKGE